MAESISNWMAHSVIKAVTPRVQQHGSTNIEDMPFEPGSKVQIKRFLGYEASNVQTHIGRLEGYDANDNNDDLDSSRELGIGQKPALWAVVGDRRSEVMVRFSPEAVTWFDNSHSRELITLSRAIVTLLYFRPSVSAVGPQLATGQSGPFAPVQKPRLCLDVRDLHVVGNINDVILWATDDLQDLLMQSRPESEEDYSPGDAKRFRQWLAAARRRIGPWASKADLSRKSQRRSDRAPQSQSSPAQATMPPPYQPAPKKARIESDKEERIGQSFDASPMFEEDLSSIDALDRLNDTQQVGWGNFTLSDAAAELFGIRVGGAIDPAKDKESFPTEDSSVPEASIEVPPGRMATPRLSPDLPDDYPVTLENSAAQKARIVPDKPCINDVPSKPRSLQAELPPALTESETGAASTRAIEVVAEQSKGKGNASRQTAEQVVRTRAKITRRITEDEREKARQEYEALLAQLHR